MEAIILAGGLGTRIRNVIGDIPKPMAPIKNKPFVEYILNYLELNNVKKVILSVGYKNEYIIKYFGETYRSLKLLYSKENSPLGTGGAIVKSMSLCQSSNIIVMNGDSFHNIDLAGLFNFHLRKYADITIASNLSDNVSRYGVIKYDKDDRVISFKEKPESDGANYINSGIYIIKKDFLNSMKLPKVFSFESEILEQGVCSNSYYTMKYDEWFVDIGVPEGLLKANHLLADIIKI